MLFDALAAICRRTVDHTGPYVRMLLERLRSPKSLSVMPPPPTAAGALEVPPAEPSSLQWTIPELSSCPVQPEDHLSHEHHIMLQQSSLTELHAPGICFYL